MRALTLWRPWHFAILHLERAPKRVENRPWKPWPSVIGKRIALHAGRHWDNGVGFATDDPRCQDEGIVGTAVVKGWIHVRENDLLVPPGVARSSTLTAAEAGEYASDRWFFGPYGWVLDDVRALAEPISCAGALGLWRLPHPIESQLVLGGYA